MNGADMAVFQAARAFELFTGTAADIDKMRGDFATARRAASA
jgi:shikimate 5-dehydrogenase